MQHTYIFQPGKWQSTGAYYDQETNSFQVYGEAEILHLSNQWVLDGFMEVKSEPPVRFTNKYAIIPPVAKELFASWAAQNPAFGKLIGKFIIEDEAIISLYTSEDNKYSGAEFLYYINAGEYTGRGYLFQGDKKMASWEITLKHVD
jgi:hypothetical protein